ncbi:MAG: BREX-3 system P-loop-containing protein BrxF [Candidatus Saccharibacteria bacterium]|nr:BREX-3 system P-loop-containing protein BrxF [Moraxellaceae bacterium]
MDLDSIKHAILRAKRYHIQLVILIGNSSTQFLIDASNADNFQPVNVGLELSTKLLDIPLSDRPKVAAIFFAELITQKNAEIVFLDHVEILFDRSLSIDPLKLLKNCAKNTTLVIAWPGTRQGSSLIYATPNHPEYRLYKESELNELIFVEANETHKEIT